MQNNSKFWDSFRMPIKIVFIGTLLLLLLVPTIFIRDLVSERQDRQHEAIAEISSRWASNQTITGPVIGIPYVEIGPGKVETKNWAYFLPSKLDIRSRLIPEKRYRGIFQVIIYTTELDISGSYDSLHLDELNLTTANMLWKEATLFFDVSDLRGLNEDMILHLTTTGAANASAANAGAANSDLTLAPARRTTDQFKSALTGTLPDWLASNAANLQFSATIKLKGTGNLSFIPVGRETTVQTTSSWSDPSFSGSALPDIRTVKDSGFVANWKVLGLNRKFPQQWKENIYTLGDAFGVSLIVPVDIYQQTNRSVKYAVLIILMTFTAFLLIEWVGNRSIHPVQYTLVGFALCIFYTLLLSFSEYIGFDGAYAIAAAATIGLIAWYIGKILRSGRMSALMIFLLTVQYGFVFTLIQLQDYALLMGSIGLFITLAIVMYFSGKVKWEKQEEGLPQTQVNS